MDVLFAFVPPVAAGHQPLAHRRIHIQVNHRIRCRDPQQTIFKVKQPGQEPIPLLPGQLAALMHRIGSGVAVGNNNATIGIELPPIPLEGCKAIHRVKSGGGIGVHIRWIRAELPGEVHLYQS